MLQKHSDMSSKQQFLALLLPFQEKIEQKIKTSVFDWGKKTLLRDACEYALLNGGKRFRPALVFIVAKALGCGLDVTESALAIEYFHTASLIADDLPCMDDEMERRNKPTVHHVFGEATALLASYALISAGYECLSKNVFELKKNPGFAKHADEIGVLSLQNVSFNTGFHGAVGGQFLDLNPPNTSLETLKEVIQKKTVSLFEIAFVLGWLFGGGDIKKLKLVKAAAGHFGMAFQIADDIGDMQQDVDNQRFVNVAVAFGVEKAQHMLQQEIEHYHKILSELNLASSELTQLGHLLHNL